MYFTKLNQIFLDAELDVPVNVYEEVKMLQESGL